MDFLKLAKERYSVRSFKNQPINKADLDKILEAAKFAPTGCNNQPYRILVIKSEESLDKLKNCTKCHFNAPIAALVCYNKQECWVRKYDGKNCGVCDASIVTTHMMLEAASIGVGSTWVMHFDPEAMRREFKIPANVEPVALLVMGYPADDAKPLDLHSKYRSEDETVVYDSF